MRRKFLTVMFLAGPLCQSLSAVVAICVLFHTRPDARAAQEPIVVDARKQLFLDDFLIASRTRVERRVEQAEKFSGNPVLAQTEPWESPLAILYGSILREEGGFKIWYLSRNRSGYGVSYATSDDGIRWHKPLLNLTLVDGRPSNILFTKKTIWTGSEGLPYFQELFGVHREGSTWAWCRFFTPRPRKARSMGNWP